MGKDEDTENFFTESFQFYYAPKKEISVDKQPRHQLKYQYLKGPALPAQFVQILSIPFGVKRKLAKGRLTSLNKREIGLKSQMT